MTPTIKALRAIGSTFAWRIYLPILVTTSVVAFLLIALNVWLVTLSAWWWILFTLIIMATVVVVVILSIAGILIKKVQPRQTKQQINDVQRFVDKIQNVADVVGTPKVVLLFRITKDLLSRKEDSYVRRISSETLAMQYDLRDIIAGFKEK